MILEWRKQSGDRWTAIFQAHARLSIEVAPKGDGRWNWKVVSGDATNPMATGVARSLGEAKNIVENLVKRQT